MKAMVLCAGYGTRLGDLTRQIPKPMLPVGEEPLLGHILKNLAAHGFLDIAVNLHFLPDMIRSHFGDGTAWGCRLTYVEERELLGTAGGVQNMADFLRGDEPFLVHYGDVLTNQDLAGLLRFHRQRKGIATLLVHSRPGSNSALSVADDGRIVQFIERPTEAERRAAAAPWVFSGVTICESALFDLIPAHGNCDLPRHVFAPSVEKAPLFAYPLSGARWAIDSPERLEQARAAVRGGLFPIPGPLE